MINQIPDLVDEIRLEQKNEVLVTGSGDHWRIIPSQTNWKNYPGRSGITMQAEKDLEDAKKAVEK